MPDSRFSHTEGYLYFDAALYGPANLLAPGGGMNGKAMRYQKRYGDDGELVNYFAAQLDIVGDAFKKRVSQRFNQTHGRTGETAQSIRAQQYWRTSNARGVRAAPSYIFDIEIGGHVAYVINPIQGHWIQTKSALELANAQSGPFSGRTQNFYSPFSGYDSPLDQVYWYQGGSESYSPDKSWYEEDTGLQQAAMEAMSLMASRAVLLWGGGANARESLPLTMPSHNVFSLGSNYVVG